MIPCTEMGGGRSSKFRWKQARCRLGDALSNEVIGVEPVDDGVQRVWFGPVLLGLLDERKGYTKTASKGDSSWLPLQSPSGLLFTDFTRCPSPL